MNLFGWRSSIIKLMTPNQVDLFQVVDIAKQAGQIIMDVYLHGSPKTTYKADKTPLTRADTLADQYIVTSLKKLYPELPIVSEESLDKADEQPASQLFWLVDPLDGTSDFLERNNEFTVNIALISQQRPVLGVVYAPAKKTIYYGSQAEGVWRQTDGHAPKTLPIQTKRTKPVVIVGRYRLDRRAKNWLEHYPSHSLISVGSSLKLCYLAEGQADIYPRFVPQMKWDIAATNCVGC
jgi:3'(2'), 5'-bisphosphate nucleotidase